MENRPLRPSTWYSCRVLQMSGIIPNIRVQNSVIREMIIAFDCTIETADVSNNTEGFNYLTRGF